MTQCRITILGKVVDIPVEPRLALGHLGGSECNNMSEQAR